MHQETAPAAARVAASTALLDRGWGKPAQPHDGDGEGGAIQHEHRFTDEQRAKALAVFLAKQQQGQK